MEEIQKKLKDEIKNFYEQKKTIEELNITTNNLQEDMKQIEEEQKDILDKESGFYTDLETKKAEKNTQFITILNERMGKENQLKNAIIGAKSEIIEKLQKKLKIIDANRNMELEENLEDLEAEKETIEKELKLNEVTREEFDTLSNAEKQAVRKAKERYLINKNRLKEIEPKIEMLYLLDGNKPKERYLEISKMITDIKEKFTYENIESLYEEYKEPENEIDNQAEEQENEEVKAEEGVNAEKPEKEEVKPQEQSQNEVHNQTVSQPRNNIINTKPMTQTKKEQPENDIDNQQDELSEATEVYQDLNISDEKVKIIYNAKRDTYTITNVNKIGKLVVERTKLEEYDKIDISKQKDTLSNIESLDINVLKLLSIYDKKFGTNKTEQYTQIVLAEKERENTEIEMEEKQISITYNLKGLYDKKQTESEYDEQEDVFTKEEKETLLNLANNAKARGIATVKKGIYVTIREQLDNIMNSINQFRNRKAIAEQSARIAREEKEEKQRQYDAELEENERIVDEAIAAKEAENEQISQTEQEEKTLTQREQFVKEHEMNPIYKLYLEESKKPGFDANKFKQKHIWLYEGNNMEALEALAEIEHYEEEQQNQANNKEEQQNQANNKEEHETEQVEVK